MVQSKRPLKRLLALLLALVMTLALLPIAVLADEIESGTQTEDGWNGDGNPPDGWGYYNRNKWIARLTLVFFPNGTERWNEGYITYGQLDTSSDYDSDGLKDVGLWYRTNALEYIKRGYKDSWWNYQPPRATIGGYTDKTYKEGFVDWHSIWKGSEELPALLSKDISGENLLLKFFTEPDPDSKDGGLRGNKIFDAVIQAVSAAGDIEKIGLAEFKSGKSNMGGAGGEYRLIVEVGVKATVNGTPAVVTLRDMSAYDLNHSDAGRNKFKTAWFRSAQWPAYGLCLTRDEFTSGTGDNIENPNNKAFVQVPASERSEAEHSKTMNDFTSAGPGSGYGIGIINPGDMGGGAGNYESYVGRVNLYIPTNGQTVANPKDNIQVGSEVYTYVGQRADLLGDLINYNWKNPYDPNSSRGKSVDENSAQAQDEYKTARSPMSSIAAGLYGSMEGTIRNELFNSSLSAKNFDSAMSAVNTDGIVDHNVVKAAPALKEGLEWGYVGEAVFNLNMYRSTGTGQSKSPLTQTKSALYDFLAQALPDVVSKSAQLGSVEFKDSYTWDSSFAGSMEDKVGRSAGMGGITGYERFMSNMADGTEYLVQLDNLLDQFKDLDPITRDYKIVEMLTNSNGLPTGNGSSANSESLHKNLGTISFRKMAIMAPSTLVNALQAAAKDTSGKYKHLGPNGLLYTALSHVAWNELGAGDDRVVERFIKEVSLGAGIEQYYMRIVPGGVGSPTLETLVTRMKFIAKSGAPGTEYFAENLSTEKYCEWLDGYSLFDVYNLKSNQLNSTSSTRVGYGHIKDGVTEVGFAFDTSALYNMVRSSMICMPISTINTYTANYAEPKNGVTRGVVDEGINFSIGGWGSIMTPALVAGDRDIRAAWNLDAYSQQKDAYANKTRMVGAPAGTAVANGLSTDAQALASLATMNAIGSTIGEEASIAVTDNNGAISYEIMGNAQISVAMYAPSIKHDTVMVSEYTQKDGTKGYKIEGIIYNDNTIPVGGVTNDKVYLENKPTTLAIGDKAYKPIVAVMGGYSGDNNAITTGKLENKDIIEWLIENKDAIKAGEMKALMDSNYAVSGTTTVAYGYRPGDPIAVGVDMTEAFENKGDSAVQGTSRSGTADPKAIEEYMEKSQARFKQFVLVEPQSDLQIITVKDGETPSEPTPVTPGEDGNVTPPDYPDYEQKEWVKTKEPPEDIKDWSEVPDGEHGTDPKVPVDPDDETIYVHYVPKPEGGQFVGANRLTESRIANGTTLSSTVSGGLQPNKVTTDPHWSRWCPGHGTKENPKPCPDQDKDGCVLVHISWSDHYMRRHEGNNCNHKHSNSCAIYGMPSGPCDCEYQYRGRCVNGNEIELDIPYYSSCGNWSVFTKEDADVDFYIGWANSTDSPFTAEGATVAAGEWAGGFKPLYSYNGGGAAESKTKLIHHDAPWDYGDQDYMEKHVVEMFYDMFRGSDKVTIASLQNSPELNKAMTDAGLKLPSGTNKPMGTRANGNYSDTIKFVMDKIQTEDSDYGSYATTSGAKVDYSKDGTVEISSVTYNATIDVDVFRDPTAGVGNAKAANNAAQANGNTIKIGGNVYGNVLGTAVNNSDVGPDSGKNITFHPYVRMFYGKPNDTAQENTVNVLADQVSTISPVDYVEVGYRHKTTGTNLNLTSTQWSTHKTATGKWGANNVLPGGALYQLNVAAGTETEVGASVWFTFIEDADAPKFLGGASTYSYNEQMNDVRDYLTSLRASIESYDVVEMLEDNASTSANPLVNGKEILMKGGQALFDGLKSSDDGKYWLNRGTYGNTAANAKSNRADLDVIADTSMQTFFCVWSDVEGNVYVGKSNTIDGAKGNVIAKISKGETAATLINKTQDTKDLDARTKLITNFIAAIDRNKGNDVSLQDPRWYNEANDGIYVCKYDAVMTLGFNTTNPVRTAAIDPKQEAPRASQSALFGDANAAAFKIAMAPTFKPDVQGYMGTFKGQNVTITKPDMMLSSKVFWIPNVSVTDLY